MNRMVIVVVCVIIALSTVGCSFVTYGPNGVPINSIGTSIQGVGRLYNNQLTILNQTKWPLAILVNGQKYSEPLLPGKSFSLSLFKGWANSYASHEVSVLVAAYNDRGDVISAEKRLSVSTYSTRAESWAIRPNNLR